LIETSALSVLSQSPTCQDCPYGGCRYRPLRVKSWIIAYREARKAGDDPAEYIRDSVKSSRPTCPPCHKPDPTDPGIRSEGKVADPFWHAEAAADLERARDQGGIPLDAWNADKIAAFLCSRSGEQA
jgi:hypothetical protein